MRDFEANNLAAISPLPPIQKINKSNEPEAYWPGKDKPPDNKRTVKPTFEEKINAEIAEIVNMKIEEEPKEIEKTILPSFHLHISEEFSVGPGQTVADPTFAYTKQEARLAYKEIHQFVVPKVWEISKDRNGVYIDKLSPEDEILRYEQHQSLLLKILSKHKTYLSHLETEIISLESSPSTLPAPSLDKVKELHDQAIANGEEKKRMIAEPLPEPPQPEEVIRVEYIDPDYHDFPRHVIELGIQVQEEIDKIRELDKGVKENRPWYKKLEQNLISEQTKLKFQIEEVENRNAQLSEDTEVQNLYIDIQNVI